MTAGWTVDAGTRLKASRILEPDELEELLEHPETALISRTGWGVHRLRNLVAVVHVDTEKRQVLEVRRAGTEVDLRRFRKLPAPVNDPPRRKPVSKPRPQRQSTERERVLGRLAPDVRSAVSALLDDGMISLSDVQLKF